MGNLFSEEEKDDGYGHMATYGRYLRHMEAQRDYSSDDNDNSSGGKPPASPLVPQGIDPKIQFHQPRKEAGATKGPCKPWTETSQGWAG